MDKLVSIYSKTFSQLEEQLVALSLKKFNAKQIFNWIYQKKCTSFDEMTDIAINSRQILKEHFSFSQLKALKINLDSNDETVKFLWQLTDGNCIETVVMKFNYGFSVCISTQVGCNMNCQFCASGLSKKIRNLSIDEIVLQYFQANNYVEEKYHERINNIVVMGIGEPFDNFTNLVSSIEILTNHHGLGIGSRHVTVSTCGIVDKIIEFAKTLPQVNLAISLHASNNETRSQLMPINKVYNLEKLMETLRQYDKYSSRRLSFEYILLENINDTKSDALQLVKLLNGLTCYVNIIPYNNVSEGRYKRSKNAKMFCQILNENKLIATIRLERGKNIDAACGQLRIKHEKTRK